MGYGDNTAEALRGSIYSSKTIYSEDRIKRDIREAYPTQSERDHLAWEQCPDEDLKHLADAYGITMEKVRTLVKDL